MTKRYSYLDSLNAGRERRSGTSYEDINRALDNLESTFDSLSTKRRGTAPGWAPPMKGRERDERDQWLERANPRGGRGGPSWPGQDLASLTRDIDRARAQEDSLSSISRIASDLTALRRELRGEMTQALSGQFDTLRRDIESLYRTASQGRGDPAVSQELQRISAAIATLSERSDDRALNALIGEMDVLKRSVGELAHESTVRSIGDRWDDLGDRFSAVERHLANMPVSGPGDIDDRLHQIIEAVAGLPESLPIRSLEDKVRTLASAIDHFSRSQESPAPHALEAVEQRLDEIARALAATTASLHAPQIPHEPFERIEARISSLARQIEETFAGRAEGAAPEALERLGKRLDRLAEQSELPQSTLDRLAGQIERIAAIVDNTDQARSMEAIRSFEHRFEALAESLQQQQESTVRQSAGHARAIEQRLEEMIERFDAAPLPVAGAEPSAAIESRLAELSKRVGEMGKGGDNSAMAALVERLDEISGRLDDARGPAQIIDPDLVRNLETQVAGLSALLARPDQVAAMPDDIALRLDRLEDAVSVNRNAVLDAARAAAEEAIRSAPGNPNGPAILALADDLKTLDSLARRADERNTKTFEAIHETLLKIVDRLVMLESTKPAPATAAAMPAATAAAEKIQVRQSPALEHEPDPEDLGPVAPAPQRMSRRMSRSPAEAATEAAFAAIEREAQAPDNKPEEKKSLLGGLAKALGRSREPKSEAAAPTMEAVPEPAAEPAEEMEAALANQPLAPGSGAPDLNAIMRRVREERKGPGGAGDAGQADFVAAARRAAQAAAAEAETLKKRADKPGSKGGSLVETLKARRKPILLAVGAIVIALSGLQLGKQFFSDAPQPEMAIQADEPAQPNEPAAAAGDAGQPDTANGGQNGGDVRMAEPSAPAEPVAQPPAEAAATPAGDVAAQPPRTEAAAPAETPLPAPVLTDAKPAPAYAPPESAGPFALVEAAKSGDANALFEIGARFAEGRNGSPDLAAAATWYEKAADLGLAPAQYRIGNLYEKGTGVERDLDKAKTWYQMAAEQGNASAMHNLGVLFATGTGQGADNESAARWFQAAAELGVKDSQYNLGILSAKGIGMPQNLEDSYKWFALAAKAGDKDAAAKRDEIAKALRPEQLEKARGATELWQPKELNAAANTVEVPAAWSDGDSRTASVDMQKAVKNIQAILNKNGFDAGTPDGVMGARTKAAIAAYQKANGLQETGELDEALVRSMLERK